MSLSGEPQFAVSTRKKHHLIIRQIRSFGEVRCPSSPQSPRKLQPVSTISPPLHSSFHSRVESSRVGSPTRGNLSANVCPFVASPSFANSSSIAHPAIVPYIESHPRITIAQRYISESKTQLRFCGVPQPTRCRRCLLRYVCFHYTNAIPVCLSSRNNLGTEGISKVPV
jgi:hypothetical protein